MAKKNKRLRDRDRNYSARTFLRAVGGIGVWAILPDKLEALRSIIDDYRASGDLSEEQVRAAFGYDDEERRPEYRVVDGVAIVPCVGPLAPKPNLMLRWMGGTSTEQFVATVAKAMADPDVKAVLGDFDTPGGSAIGCAEAHEALLKLRNDKKPMVAMVNNGICASAGYFIASSFDKIVLGPSTMAGSIGTVYLHIEYAQLLEELGYGTTVIRDGKYKWAANPYETLSKDGQDTLQEMVSDYYRQFVEAVARGRGVTTAKVESDFGQGKMLIADRAVTAGLADRVATIEQVVSELAARQTATQTRAADPVTTPQAKEMIVNPLLIKALVKRGLITAGATDAECMAALNAFYAMSGKPAPDLKTDDGQMQAVQDLVVAAAAPAATPAAIPAAAPAGGSASATAATPASQAPATPAPGTEARTTEAATVAERTRVQNIRERGRTLNIDQALVDAAIDNGTTVEAALLQWTERRANNEQPLPIAGRDVSLVGSGVDNFAVGCAEVLAHRCGHSDPQGLSSGAKQLSRLRMADMARQALHANGTRGVELMDDEDVCQMYLALGDRHSIPSYGSDVNAPGTYPNIFSLLARKLLDDAREAAETTYELWTARMPSVPDFLPRTIIEVGMQSELPIWPDQAEIEGSKSAEEVSWISVDRYGDEWNMSPVMMANNELGVFEDMATQKQIAHDLTVNRLAVNLITGNPTLPDGYALFSTEHNNDITGGTGGAPSVAQANLMRQKHRLQTDVTGRVKIRVSPSLALLPSQHETAGEQTFLPIPAGDVARAVSADTGINTFRGKIRPVVEQMLDDQATAGAQNDWFTFAPTNRVKVIVVMFQSGFEAGGKRMSYYDPKTGCRFYQIEGRFGSAVRSFRGVVRNSGGS